MNKQDNFNNNDNDTFGDKEGIKEKEEEECKGGKDGIGDKERAY